ncbi:hypothetical protein ACJRO7_023424 [Eucalyptus globulus]|uniref:Secreted protein n=1 Tax=Eucalyptus globulus TaxID=34317 RepID=A0ABD3K6S2_EUCGL
MRQLVVLVPVLVPEGAAISPVPPPLPPSPNPASACLLDSDPPDSPASVAAEVSRLRHDPNPDRAFSFFRPVASLWTLTFASSVCVLSPLHLPLPVPALIALRQGTLLFLS